MPPCSFPRENSTSKGDIAPGQLHLRMPSRSSPRSSSASVELWLSSSSSESHHYYHAMPDSPTTHLMFDFRLKILIIQSLGNGDVIHYCYVSASKSEEPSSSGCFTTRSALTVQTLVGLSASTSSDYLSDSIWDYISTFGILFGIIFFGIL